MATNAHPGVGIAQDLGGRTTQQDDLLSIPAFLSPAGGRVFRLFAIFDGHGSDGHKAAKAATVQFPLILESLKTDIISDPLQALKVAFQKVNEELCNDSTWDSYLSGTTAVLLLLSGNTLHVAHVGDSRLAIISHHGSTNKWSGRIMTEDHTCQDESEKNRIISSGGRVEQLMINGQFDGPLRIFKGSLPYPGITVSRSLGDAAAQRIGVLCEPSVSTITLGSNDKYIVLATDGLWDGISIEEATKIFSAQGPGVPAGESASILLKAGLKGLSEKHIDDNVTVVVISHPFSA